MSNQHDSTTPRPMTPEEIERHARTRNEHTTPPQDPYSPYFNDEGVAQPAARRAGKTTRINELRNTAKRKPWILPAAIAAAALLLGIGIGASGTNTETIEVTKEVPVDKPYPVEKRIEVPVNVTPQACITALDLNEQAFSGLSESLGYIMDRDYAAATTTTERVKALTPRVNAAKAECRASAK